MPRLFLIALFACSVQFVAFAKIHPKLNPLGFNPRVQTLAFIYPVQAQLIFQAAEEANNNTDKRF